MIIPFVKEGLWYVTLDYYCMYHLCGGNMLFIIVFLSLSHVQGSSGETGSN